MENRFFLLWLFVWQPLVSAGYVFTPVVAEGDMRVWWAISMVYMYLLFAPAIYWVFFRKPGA